MVTKFDPRCALKHRADKEVSGYNYRASHSSNSRRAMKRELNRRARHQGIELPHQVAYNLI